MVFDRAEHCKAKVTCHFCNKVYIRANQSHHYNTKRHIRNYLEYKNSLSDEQKEFLGGLVYKFGIDDLRRLSS